MAEHAPKQTPVHNTSPTPPHNGGEAHGIDPTVVLDFDPSAEPAEKIAILREKLQADSTLRGFEDMRGLDLRTTDDEGFGYRFVVTGSHTRPVYEEQEQTLRFSRPRIVKPILEARHENGVRTWHFNGRNAFARPKISSEYRLSGRPRLVKHGSSRNIDRGRERVDPTYKQFVTVEAYEEIAGEMRPRKPETMLLSDFFEMAGATLTGEHRGTEAPHAEWDWKQRDTAEASNPDDELVVGLTRGGKPVYQDVSEQLEGHDITDWTGLTWDLAVPQPDKVLGNDSSKKGIPVHNRTVEITSDDIVEEIEHDLNGEKDDKIKYWREFRIQTTEHYADGSSVAVDDIALKDYELWHYFEKPGDFLRKLGIPKGTSVYNMRLPGAASRSGQDFEIPSPSGAERAWGLPSYPSLDEALGMLARPEFYTKGAKGAAALKAHVELMKQGEEKEYAEELQRTLAETGFDYFYDIVEELHGKVFEGYAHRAEQLDLPEQLREEDSLSWTMESLMKRALERRQNGDDQPFDSVLRAPGLVRSLADQLVGELFGQASVRSEKITVPDGLDDDNKPKVKEKIVHEFNEDLFEQVRIPSAGDGSYGALAGILAWRNKIWMPIRHQTEDICDQLIAGESIDYKDYQRLGRELSRTIGL